MFEHQKEGPSGVRTPAGLSFWCSNTSRTVLLVFEHQKDGPSGARTPEGRSVWWSNTSSTPSGVACARRRLFLVSFSRSQLRREFFRDTHLVSPPIPASFRDPPA